MIPARRDDDYASVVSAGAFFANRLRAISAAAAPPNSRIIGGAGTGSGPPDELEPWWPLEPPQCLPHLQPQLLEVLQPLDVLQLPLDEVDDEVDDEVEEDVDELTPLDVEDEVDELTPLEVEVEEPPVDVEVEEPPVEVDEPPDEVLVDEPPLEISMLMPLLLPELLPELPKKPPAKKPPPKPPPYPAEPPITPAAALLAAATTGISRGGRGIGAPCVVTTTTCGCVVVVVVTRRTSFLRTTPATGALRMTRFFATVYCLTTLGCVTRSTA